MRSHRDAFEFGLVAGKKWGEQTFKTLDSKLLKLAHGYEYRKAVRALLESVSEGFFHGVQQEIKQQKRKLTLKQQNSIEEEDLDEEEVEEE
jgi:hypothetical protein